MFSGVNLIYNYKFFVLVFSNDVNITLHKFKIFNLILRIIIYIQNSSTIRYITNFTHEYPLCDLHKGF